MSELKLILDAALKSENEIYDFEKKWVMCVIRKHNGETVIIIMNGITFVICRKMLEESADMMKDDIIEYKLFSTKEEAVQEKNILWQRRG